MDAWRDGWIDEVRTYKMMIDSTSSSNSKQAVFSVIVHPSVVVIDPCCWRFVCWRRFGVDLGC